MTEERDDRSFSERVEKVNVAFLVRLPLKNVERLAQLVEDDLNETEGRLVYTKVDSERLFIGKARPLTSSREERESPERRRYDYGRDDQ